MEKFQVIYAALEIKTVDKKKSLIDPCELCMLNEQSTECIEILI